MKKTVVFLFLSFLIGTSAFCQMQKGTWVVQGELGFSKSKISVDNSTFNYQPKPIRYSISPGVGYFISDKTVIGIQGLFGGSGVEVGPSDVASTPVGIFTKNYGAGVFLRNYIPSSEKISFFFDFDISYFKYDFILEYDNPPRKETEQMDQTFSAGIDLGIQYLINKRIGIHLSSPALEYSSTSVDYSQDLERSQNETFSFQFLKSLNLGATIFL